MKWTIVAFNHPEKSRSVVYRQNLTNDALIQAIRIAIAKGANLMSIRGVGDKEKPITSIKPDKDIRITLKRF